MSTIFPRVGRKSLGYNITQVETFLDAARRAYDQPDDDELDADTGVVEFVDTIAASGDPNRTVSGASVPDDTRVFSTGVHQKVETKASRGSAALTAEGIRHTAFAMHKDGYSPDHVDAALERLEDAFAARERDQATRAGGEQAWMADAESAANVLVARLSRPPGQRFTRASVLAVGYKRADVDRLANKLVKHFRHGHEVTVDEVRTAVFRPERGGYREAQVDLVLDSAVDVMLAVR